MEYATGDAPLLFGTTKQQLINNISLVLNICCSVLNDKKISSVQLLIYIICDAALKNAVLIYVRQSQCVIQVLQVRKYSLH